MGGDAIDLVGYVPYGTAWNRRDKPMFKVALREASAFAGVDRIVSENAAGHQIHIAIAGNPRPIAESENDTAGTC